MTVYITQNFFYKIYQFIRIYLTMIHRLQISYSSEEHRNE